LNGEGLWVENAAVLANAAMALLVSIILKIIIRFIRRQ
jgi:hypothetical protein